MKNINLLFRFEEMQSLIQDLCPAGVFGQIFQKAVYYLGSTGGECV